MACDRAHHEDAEAACAEEDEGVGVSYPSEDEGEEGASLDDEVAEEGEGVNYL